MLKLFKELGGKPLYAFLLLGLGVIWLALIIASGAGWNPFPWPWNFSNPGAFGDSFGPLSALMATVAAVGAIAAYQAQSAEARRLRVREEELDRLSADERSRTISREFLADERSARQSFEATFFRLVEHLRTQVQTLDVEIWAGQPERGQDAFEALLQEFRQIVEVTPDDIKRRWATFAQGHRNDLNHYFRLLYHIVRFVEKSQIDNDYFYIQILRAMLSDSELCLLALNCEYGFGREKFKDLIEAYALLHNLSEEEIRFWRLRELYAASAFEHEVNLQKFEFVEMEEAAYSDENEG